MNKNARFLRDAEAMYQTFANERLPPGAGRALAVQCQKFLGVGEVG